ncbi:MAG: tRNA (guanosine(46)-N7)-methyltransferase TrmB [Acidimicrobiales bacterium]|nr:tRNA (guanosine(46)-N7)-methyltransferase TrmB [Acidimicrobiales bacterium]
MLSIGNASRPDPDRAVLLDIGVGNGVTTLACARSHPDLLVLAVEVHQPSIARLLRSLEQDPLPNIRVVEADAVQLLDAMPGGSLAVVQVLFPDPWPKRRHHHRRMVDRAFATMAADALTPGGHLVVATDWPDYASHMRSAIATEPRLEPVGDGSRPDRPVTAYERRGLDAGRPIADLRYRRRPSEG